MKSSVPSRRALVIAVVALFAVWAAAWLHFGRVPVPPTPVAASDAGWTTHGEPDAAVPAVGGELAKIPERLPEFSLRDPTGAAMSIARFAGKSLILNFWATWCAPCRREIPLLQSLHVEWSGRDIEVVGVAVDYPEKVIAYAKGLKITYPLMVGEEDALAVAAKFGVNSPVFPFTVFTDGRGDVVAVYVGELHQPQVDLILSVVRNLNSNRLQLAEARRNVAAGLQALAPDRPG